MTRKNDSAPPDPKRSESDSRVQYPGWYTSEFQTKEGTHYTIRPIRSDDEPSMVAFHGELSEETVYRRYFAPMRLDVRVAHERLAKRCLLDYPNEMALVATYPDANGEEKLAAVARLIKIENTKAAEVAFLVSDKHQHRGLGTYLLERMIEIAKKDGLEAVEALVLTENFDMNNLFRRAGFKFLAPEGSTLMARLELVQAPDS
jgi:acetyltransferase